jgi:hypothetical protein
VSSPLPLRDPAPPPLWYNDAVIYRLHVKTFPETHGVIGFLRARLKLRRF